MVVEHNVATMVRLSDTEDTWQYWPSDEGERTLSFGYMTVTLINRETRVSYVKREFKVSNTKVGITFIGVVIFHSQILIRLVRK